MNGPAVGRLDQHFHTIVGELFDVTGSQRRPPLPRVDVLASNGHDHPMVLIAPLTDKAARPLLTSESEDPEHDFSSPAENKDMEHKQAGEQSMCRQREQTETDQPRRSSAEGQRKGSI